MEAQEQVLEKAQMEAQEEVLEKAQGAFRAHVAHRQAAACLWVVSAPHQTLPHLVARRQHKAPERLGAKAERAEAVHTCVAEPRAHAVRAAVEEAPEQVRQTRQHLRGVGVCVGGGKRYGAPADGGERKADRF
eukprot:353194-Chlamydomonas_euryale.AAC.2